MAPKKIGPKVKGRPKAVAAPVGVAAVVAPSVGGKVACEVGWEVGRLALGGWDLSRLCPAGHL
jgi:hypothetical protein